MKLKNIPFRIESELMSWWWSLLKQRPTSDPYVSGDSLRALCSWHFEPENRQDFDPANVSPGSLGFCDGWLLREFLSGPATRITRPFRLLSHNSDVNITEDLVSLLPENLETLYSTNVLVSHPRVVPLPIGLENARLHYNGVTADFERLRRRPVAKKPRILVAFTMGTNPITRGTARRHLDSLPTVDVVSRLGSREYRKIAATYQFIASPPGNGEDCHRTWEALYLRCIPVVLRSTLTEAFLQLGLPILVVDSYEELTMWTVETLERRYQEWAPLFDNEALWMTYWRKRVGIPSL